MQSRDAPSYPLEPSAPTMKSLPPNVLSPAVWLVALGLLLAAAPPNQGQRGAADGGAAPEPQQLAPSEDGASAVDDEERLADPRVSELRSRLLGLLSAPGWRNDLWGVLVVSLDRGDTLFAHEPHRALTPASNMKLFTTAAALHYLGPQYRFGTYLLTTAPVRNGILDGDLVLYGTGDPSISKFVHDDVRDVWRMLADSLAAEGIREIRGHVVGDASYFESPSVPRGWLDSYRSADYAAPASALSFSDNVVSLQVKPASSAGWRPEVEPIPGGRGIAVVNLATTGGGGRVRVERVAYDGPIVVEGSVGQGQRPVWGAVPVADPARYAATTLREALVERGIRVHGGVRVVQDPSRSVLAGQRVYAPAYQGSAAVPRVLAVHRSPPLGQILEVINQRSHNLFAEQILRVLGRQLLGDGSPEGGARVLRGFLADEVGIDTEGLHIFDGSGLSSLNRVTPASIIALLSHMAGSPWADAYFASLPEAGTSRGLRRMQSTPAEGNLRAKTGTINHVSALSGYVTASNGERLGFSIISNEVPSTWAAKLVENRIGAQLASFDRPRSTASPPERLASADTLRPDLEGADTAAATETAPASAAAAEHTIRSGDTLEGIAREHGISVADLRAANPEADPRRLIPGRALRLPAAAGDREAPARAPVVDENGAAEGTERLPPTREHTIRAGDTLEGIARHYGISVDALQRANPGVSPRRLIPGRTLRLPA